jgi:hypothetical protein
VSDELVNEGLALVAEAAADGLVLRLLGGAAIVLHTSGSVHREIADLDAATRGSDTRRLADTLHRRGYKPEARFNALHGHKRLIFHGPSGKLDVFVDTFEMSHRIDLRLRLGLDSPTLTVSDLLLTKLQVVELNAKDAHDVVLLLEHHELGEGSGDHIDLEYLARLSGDDWGLWRTMTETLDRVAEHEPEIASKSRALKQVLEEAPKSRGFRLRARVGERKRWYELPEDMG